MSIDTLGGSGPFYVYGANPDGTQGRGGVANNHGVLDANYPGIYRVSVSCSCVVFDGITNMRETTTGGGTSSRLLIVIMSGGTIANRQALHLEDGVPHWSVGRQ